MGIFSTLLFLVAGFKLISIQSVSGNSIAESFYHGIGWMSFAFALFSGGLLFGFAEKFPEDEISVPSSKTLSEEIPLSENKTSINDLSKNIVDDMKRVCSFKDK